MKEKREIMVAMLDNIMRKCPSPVCDFSDINMSIMLEDGFITMTCIPTHTSFLIVAQDKKVTLCLYPETAEKAEELIIEAFNTCGAFARFSQLVK